MSQPTVAIISVIFCTQLLAATDYLAPFSSKDLISDPAYSSLQDKADVNAYALNNAKEKLKEIFRIKLNSRCQVGLNSLTVGPLSPQKMEVLSLPLAYSQSFSRPSSKSKGYGIELKIALD